MATSQRLLRPRDGVAAPPRGDEHYCIAERRRDDDGQRGRANEEQLRELQREQTEKQRARVKCRIRDERHRREDRRDVGQRERGKRRSHHIMPALDDDGHERDEREIDRNDGEDRPQRPVDSAGESEQRRRGAEADGHHQASRRLPHDDVRVVHQPGPHSVRRSAEHPPERRQGWVNGRL